MYHTNWTLPFCIWYIISPRFQKLFRKFNPTLHHWATAFFSKDLGQYAIWVYVVKYFNIAIWFRISPRCQIRYQKFNPTLFQRATAFFVQKGFLVSRILYKCSPDFLGNCQSVIPTNPQRPNPFKPLSIILSLNIYIGRYILFIWTLDINYKIENGWQHSSNIFIYFNTFIIHVIYCVHFKGLNL